VPPAPSASSCHCRRRSSPHCPLLPLRPLRGCDPVLPLDGAYQGKHLLSAHCPLVAAWAVRPRLPWVACRSCQASWAASSGAFHHALQATSLDVRRRWCATDLVQSVTCSVMAPSEFNAVCSCRSPLPAMLRTGYVGRGPGTMPLISRHVSRAPELRMNTCKP
jgi:hypothetical protein